MSLFLTASKIYCQANKESQQIDTRINVTLNDRLKTLDGNIETNYTNRSPDTLTFIWFHIWPNAFKNDRTAFSEYMLQRDRTDFYFSDKEKRGYINRLNFAADGIVLQREDHLKYIDIVKVILYKPLLPGAAIAINTPFHVKLPYSFDSIGYVNNREFDLKYWYPFPALYDKHGWHPQPYTGNRTEFLSSANYNVSISLHKNFYVESNAELVDSAAHDSLQTLQYKGKHLHDLSFHLYQGARISQARQGEMHIIKPVNFRKTILSRKFFPLPGYNRYDGLQLGFIFHEPDDKKPFNFFAVPMFALNSKKIVGLAGVDYLFTPVVSGKKQEMIAGLNLGTFSTNEGVDSSGKKIFSSVYKLVPFFQWHLPASSPKIFKTIELRSFILNEQGFDYKLYSVDSFYYPTRGKHNTTCIGQASFNYFNTRALYPYNAQIQLQQGPSFYRINATGNYFFNFPNGGGMQVRLFAAKFGYLGTISSSKKFDTYKYQPKLTAVRGNEDYTYSNYFFGRNEFSGFNSNQILIRDGALKLRTDMFEGLQGRSDNWIASININTTLPRIFPVALPLRIFLDAGTYAEAWKRETSNPRFLYVAGLQLSLFKQLVNIFAPVLYSNQFRDRLKSVPEENKFLKRISFNIDIQRLKLTRTENYHHVNGSER